VKAGDLVRFKNIGGPAKAWGSYGLITRIHHHRHVIGRIYLLTRFGLATVPFSKRSRYLEVVK